MNTRRFSSLTISVAMLMVIIIIGEIGYMFIEDYTFLDALFMTVITISTVGFSEIKPLSTLGEMFTIFMILFSFGIFAYAVTSITRFMVDGGFRNHFINKRTTRKIKRLNNHVILIGFGRNGNEAARTLKNAGTPFLVIEKNPEIMEKVRDKKYLYIEGDATEDDVLLSAKLLKAKSLITTLPNDADNTLVVLSARTLDHRVQIISRASHEWSDVKLKRAGANNIIMPDMVGGRRMAKLVASPDIVRFLEYMRLKQHNREKLVELNCSDFSRAYQTKTIGELKFRKISGVNIVGLKDEKGGYIFNPDPEFELSPAYQLFVMANDEQLVKLKAAVYETTKSL